MFKIEIDYQAKTIYVNTPKTKYARLPEKYRLNGSGFIEHADGSAAVNASYYRPEDFIEIVEMSLPRGTNLACTPAVKALRYAGGRTPGLKDAKDFFDGFRGMGYSFVASGE